MEPKKEQKGFAKYTGKLVEDGYMDARKSAQALLGFDEAVRFFIYQQNPKLKLVDFEFPVKVEKGSWTIVVGAIITAYSIKAAQKMAEKDFDGVGLADVLKKSLRGIQWLIKIGKHLGELTIKKFNNAKFEDNNQLIGIQNSEGEYLYVPKEYLDFYVSANPSLLKKMSEIIENERTLTIGVTDGETIIEETVTTKHRRVFTRELIKEDTTVLPELIHGQQVVLDAEVTRGNEMSNTVGIQYGGHVITGIPTVGSIVRFKPSLFLNCRVHGQVLRESDSKRPKIIFDRIEPNETEEENRDLFGDDI
jgi:hypothetical protein